MTENNSGLICFQRNDQCFGVSLPGILMSLEIWGTIPGGTPYNGLYGEAPPESGTFLRLQVYERVGILLVDVQKCNEIGHLGLWKILKGPNGLTDEFYGFINPRKRTIIVINSYLKDSAFTAVKRDAKF